MTHLRVALVGAFAAVVLFAGCQPEGNVDATSLNVTVTNSTLTIAGWALDQDTPALPIDVHIYVDGNGLAVKADTPRPDVAVAKPGTGPNHGYVANVRAAAGKHDVCVFAINAPGTDGTNVKLGCRTVTVPPRPVKRPSATPTTTPPTPTTLPSGNGGATSPPPATWQGEVREAVNRARTTAGANDARACDALTSAAQRYADTIATAAWLDTTGPDGSDLWSRVEAYGGVSAAENLSFGTDTPTATTDIMLRSTIQQDNLLLPEFTDIGVGRAQGDPDGDGPQAPGYYWVILLGSEGGC